MIRCVITSICYHCLLSISYFIWYFFQRRYTARHFAEDYTTAHNSIASGLGAFDPPRVSGPSDEIPLSPLSPPRQVIYLSN